jgi:HlyD family secretion protein
MKKLLKSTGSIVVVMAFLFFSCHNDLSTSPKVSQGDFTQSITETGELQAQNARSFILPLFGRYWYRMKVIGLLEHGKRVQVGDSIIQLDPSEIKKFIIEKENQVEIQKANLEKMIVQNENQKSDLASSLKTEQASFDLKKLELEHSRFEPEKTQKIKELEFKQAEIRLQKVKQKIELNEIINKNDLKIQQLQLKQQEDDWKNAINVLPKLTMRTPIPGIFQVGINERTGQMLKVGDEIYMGNNMGSVPDLTWMKVKTIIGETDFRKIHVGQKVIVRLDALSNVPFDGEISYVGKLCHQVNKDNNKKVFDVEVKVLVSDERLKPGMTVSCEYICAKFNDVMYIPLRCIENTNEGSFIYIKKGTGSERLKVKTGPSNNTHVVIEGDIEKGLELVPIDEVSKKQNS